MRSNAFQEYIVPEKWRIHENKVDPKIYFLKVRAFTNKLHHDQVTAIVEMVNDM